MTVFLQLIALLQYFLPGYLFLCVLNLRRNLLRTILLSFALSGLFNYMFVLLLYPPGLFTRGSVLLLVLAELILLFFAKGRLKGSTFSFTALDEFFLLLPQPERRFSLCFFWLAVVTAGIQAAAALRGFGQIFSSWDSVLSWNQWAVGWFSGTIGNQRTFGYPQLIPCSWAMTYQILGEVLNFVPKGIVLLCPVLISLLLIALAWRRREDGLLAAVPLTAWFFHNTDPLAGGGEVDFVVTFFCFASIAFLLKAREERSWKMALCAGIAAIGSACVKPSGVVFLVLLPVLAAAFLLTGLGYGGVPPLNSAFTARFFGREHYAVNFSIVNMNLIAASYLGPVCGGGSYSGIVGKRRMLGRQRPCFGQVKLARTHQLWESLIIKYLYL